MTHSELASRVDQLGFWFQNVSLPGIDTNPLQPDHSSLRWELLEPFVPKNLAGMTVLDLGCNAGYFAIKMRERGAEVLGVDWYPEAIEQARFAAEVLDLDIEYRVENVYDFVLKTSSRFDYVIFMGLFYHLRYPLLVVDRLAELTRREMYFQTVVRETTGIVSPEIPQNLSDHDLLDDPGFPALYFIEHNLGGAYNNWFICNRPGVEAVLRSAGFRAIRSRGDVFACQAEPHIDRAWRASHDFSSLKTGEPGENTG